MSEKIVQRIYVRINPESGKVRTSCTETEGSTAIYVANYPGTQAGLKAEYQKKIKSQNNKEF